MNKPLPEFYDFTSAAGTELPQTPPVVQQQLRGLAHNAGRTEEFHSSLHLKYWPPTTTEAGIIAAHEEGFYTDQNIVGSAARIANNTIVLQRENDDFGRIGNFLGFCGTMDYTKDDDPRSPNPNGESHLEVMMRLPSATMLQQKITLLNSLMPAENKIIDLRPYTGGRYSKETYFDSFNNDELPIEIGTTGDTANVEGALGRAFYAAHDRMHLLALVGIQPKLREAACRSIAVAVEKDKDTGFTTQQEIVMSALDTTFTPTAVHHLTSPTVDWDSLDGWDKGPWSEALGNVANINDYVKSSRQHMATVLATIGRLTTRESR